MTGTSVQVTVVIEVTMEHKIDSQRGIADVLSKAKAAAESRVKNIIEPANGMRLASALVTKKTQINFD